MQLIKVKNQIEAYLGDRFKGATIYETQAVNRDKMESCARVIPGAGIVWFRTYHDPMMRSDFVQYEMPDIPESTATM